MTRETKIGLLVGLAFIIVIGILVSDHLSSSTEPPQAALAQSGSNARRSVHVPGANRQANPVAAPTTAPRAVAPVRQVPTSADLTPRPQPTAEIAIGPGQQGNRSPVQITGGNQQQAVAQPTHPQVAVGAPAGHGALAMAQRAAAPGTGVQALAGPQSAPLRPQPESDVVIAGPGSSNVTAIQQTPDPAAIIRQSARQYGEDVQPARLAAANARPYKAQPGDTVSRMAARMLGTNTKTNRDLIIKANPSLLADPNRIVVGQTYMIPELPAATAGSTAARTATPSPGMAGTDAQTASGLDRLPLPVTSGVLPLTQTTPAGPAAPVATASRQPVAPAPVPAAEIWYTVKERDNLWRIAVTQCGSPSAVTTIKELNKAALKGGDTVRPNMKLRLPAKAS